MRILLADDDPKIHLIIKLWLSRNGHEVESAYNGREALDKLQNENFDGLITDVNMPLMKGVDLVNAIRQLPHQPALKILLTSRCDLNQLHEQIDLPGVHLFNKPFSPAALADLIEKACKTEAQYHDNTEGSSVATTT